MTSLLNPPSDASGGAPNGPDELSLVVIQLFKGPVYREVHEKLWEPLGRLRRRVSDHVAVLGLRLEIDETDDSHLWNVTVDAEDELLVRLERAADKPHGRHAVAARFKRFFSGRDHRRMR